MKSESFNSSIRARSLHYVCLGWKLQEFTRDRIQLVDSSAKQFVILEVIDGALVERLGTSPKSSWASFNKKWFSGFQFVKQVAKKTFLIVTFGITTISVQGQIIQSVVPNSGTAGCQVTINGTGFSSTASENTVFFGKSKANVISVNSSGTQLLVNTPVNPSFPSRISVLNTVTNKYIFSDVRFKFTYGARIDPTNRNIQEQYQSEFVPNSNLTSNLGRTALAFNKGPKFCVGDYNGDNNSDIFLQLSDLSTNNGTSTGDNGRVALLTNSNPVFQFQGNNPSTGDGFTSILGQELGNGSGGPSRVNETVSNLPYPEISPVGMINADLNNDGVDEVITYGSHNVLSYGPLLSKQHAPAFSILEFNRSGSSVVTSETLQNKSQYTITSRGGVDYVTDVGNNPSMQMIQHPGDQLLVQVSVLKMQAADIDGDGDNDLVALLSWPAFRSSLIPLSERLRYQLYFFKNTTPYNSSVFTFQTCQYNNGLLNPPPANVNAGFTENPKDTNFNANKGNFIGPDYVLALDNSLFAGYDIGRWISDMSLGDIDHDGDFDVVVKGIENLGAASNPQVDTAIGSHGIPFYDNMAWLRDGNQASGIRAAPSANNGFLSWFKNNSTTSGFSFLSETIIDGSVPNYGKFDWGGIDLNDINNDGKLDVVISAPDNTSSFTATPGILISVQSSTSGSFNPSFLLAGPSGTLAPFSPQNVQGYVVSKLICEDLNGDGLQDIAITGTNMGDFYAYMRLPNTTGTDASSFNLHKFTRSYPMGEIIDLALSDFSNDGKADMVIVSRQVTPSASKVSYMYYFKNNNGLPAVLTKGQLFPFVKCSSQVSAAQKFTIGGINISQANGHKVTASVTSLFEISLDSTTGYTSSVDLIPNGYNDVIGTKVYIRAKATSNDLTFQGEMTISSFSAVPSQFDLYGVRTVPVVGTISPITQYVTTTKSPPSPPATSPPAVATPTAVSLIGFDGVIQWQKSLNNIAWSDITNSTSNSYTLPLSEIDGTGIVYLRAKVTKCTEVSYTSVVQIVENLGSPAPPVLQASNGTVLSGTYDASLSTEITIVGPNNAVIATCSNIAQGCPGWTFSNNTFTYTPSPSFAHNTQIIAFSGSNKTGTLKLGALSNAITIDANPPAAPTISLSNGTSISGVAEAGSTVTISYNEGGVLVTAQVLADAGGNFTYFPTTPISNSTVVTVKCTDVVGNMSATSTVTVDALAPTITPQFTASGAAVSNANTITGTTEPNATVVVTMSNGTNYTATANGTTGAFSVSITGAVNGSTCSVISTDPTGNSSLPIVYTVDANVVGNVYSSTGGIISGQVGELGTAVTVSYTIGNTTTTASATVSGQGFSYTPTSTIPTGTLVSFNVLDAVGNSTNLSTIIGSTTVLICRPPTAPTRMSGHTSIQLNGVVYTSDMAQSIYFDFSSNDMKNIGIRASDNIELKVINGSIPTSAKLWIDLNQNGSFEPQEETSLGFNLGTGIALKTTPFLGKTNGEVFFARLGYSSGVSSALSACSSTSSAVYSDFKFIVISCDEITSVNLTDVSISSPSMRVSFTQPSASNLTIEYIVFPHPNLLLPANYNPSTTDDQIVLDYISLNPTVPLVQINVSAAPGTISQPYSFNINTLQYNIDYQFAIRVVCGNYKSKWKIYQRSNTSSGGVSFGRIRLQDPSTIPNYSASTFQVTSHNWTQSVIPSGGFYAPTNSLKVPVNTPVTVKFSSFNGANNPVVPSILRFVDALTYIPGTLNGVLASISPNPPSGIQFLSPSGTNGNEYVSSFSRPNEARYWIAPTCKITGQDMMESGLSKSLFVEWFRAPILNANGTGLTGAVPGELVTLIINGTTYTATAGANGNVDLTSFSNGNNVYLTSDALNSLVNGSYRIDQSWSSGGQQYTHLNPTQVLSPLSINAITNSVSGTAAPGATVTLTIGNQTFVTTADAITGIYDFANTTSTTTAPSTGVGFNTLVPISATTSYTINQSKTGYTSSAAITGSILASPAEIIVPTINNAMALSNTSTTIAGNAEVGAWIYLYDANGNQLFDLNGKPVTTKVGSNGQYSITLDLSTLKKSTGSNTFAPAFSAPYTGAVVQVGSTDSQGNTAPLGAGFVNPSVFTSGSWTDASGSAISAPNLTNGSAIVRYESNATLSGGININGLEIKNGVNLTLDNTSCTQVNGSIAVQGTGAISLSSSNTNGSVTSGQLKFSGKYLGPPTVQMSGQLRGTIHTIGSPMQEGFDSVLNFGNPTKLMAWNASSGTYYYSNGSYFGAAPLSSQGRGYFAFVGTNLFLNTAGEFKVKGSPISNVVMNLGYALDVFSPTSAGSGWNLIANPFTCGWDFSLAGLANVNSAFYVKNTAASGGYSYYSTAGQTISSVIPPLQGFWVQTTSAGGTITTDLAGDGALCSSTQNTFFKTNPKRLVIRLTDIQTNDSYPIFLTEISGAQKGFDGTSDAWFLGNGNGAPEWCFKVGNEEIAANGYDFPDSLRLNVHFKHTSNSAKFNISIDTFGFSPNWEFTLLDRYTGVSYDLNQETPVVRQLTLSNEISEPRFELLMRLLNPSSDIGTLEMLREESELIVDNRGGTLIVTIPEFQKEYTRFELMDMVGRTVEVGTVDSNGIVNLKSTVPSGTYLIRLTGQVSKVERIVITK